LAGGFFCAGEPHRSTSPHGLRLLWRLRDQLSAADQEAGYGPALDLEMSDQEFGALIDLLATRNG